MSESETQEHVTIVGGGMVGSLLSVILSERGKRVHLYESRPDMRKHVVDSGRSINLTLCHRGRAALRAVGLEEDVLAKAIPIQGRMVHKPNSIPSFMPYGTKPEECLYSIDRSELNKILLTKAEVTANITIHFETKLLEVNIEKKELTFLDKSKSKVFVQSTGFIFGCDGAFSTVRQQMKPNCTQEFIEHGYKELTMPPTCTGESAMEPNYLHVWPHHDFVMIALPNPDKSFTLSLFMPFSVFESIKTNQNLLEFFQSNFPDLMQKLSTQHLCEEYFRNPVGRLVSVKCNPHYMAGITLLLGDAAHAMVPFYGQGVNAGFEDCMIFSEMLKKNDNNIFEAAKMYQKTHWRDTQAICDLSMNNYTVLRSHVGSRIFLLRNKIENVLYRLLPSYFTPLYPMVAFSHLPYHQVVCRNTLQQTMIRRGLYLVILSSLSLVGYVHGIDILYTILDRLLCQVCAWH